MRQRHQRRGTALTGPRQPDLHDLVLVDPHDLDVPAVGSQVRAGRCSSSTRSILLEELSPA